MSYQVYVQNLTQFARTNIFTVPVPFPESDNYLGTPLHVGPVQCQVEKFGATWPNGGWRHAKVAFPVILAAGEKQLVNIDHGSANLPAFVITDAVTAAFPTSVVRVRMESEIIGGARSIDLLAQTPTTLVDGHLTKKVLYKGRIPDKPFWARLVIETLSGHSHANFWLSYGYSDMTDPNVAFDAGDMKLDFEGVVPFLWEAEDKELSRVITGPTTVIFNAPASQWGDGEMQVIRGTLIWPDATQLVTQQAESTLELVGGSIEWRRTGYFPWIGFQEGLPHGQTETTAMQRAVYDLIAHQQGPWANSRLGLGPVPAASGEQEDFVAMPCLMEAQGRLERLYAVGRSVVREGHRITHVYDANADPVVFQNILPPVHIWFGRPFRTGNMLGKSGPIGKEGHPTQQEGRDWEHWTCNYLTAYALITGDHYAVEECNHLVELLMCEWTVTGGNAFLNEMGAERAVGRLFASAVQLYLVTGRADIYQRIVDRFNVTMQNKWAGQWTGPRQPFEVYGGVIAYGYYNVPHERPWQQPIAICGLDAAYQITRIPAILDMIWTVGKSFLTYGVWHESMPAGTTTAGGAPLLISKLIVGQAIVWDIPTQVNGHWVGGAPLTAAEIAAGKRSPPTPLTNWLRWSMPGVRVLRRECIARNEPGYLAICDELLGNVGNTDWRDWEFKALP